jgi:hypothetical protein
MMIKGNHEFNYGEPGLFMEIYVAKKAEFQPLLYETPAIARGIACGGPVFYFVILSLVAL